MSVKLVIFFWLFTAGSTVPVNILLLLPVNQTYKFSQSKVMASLSLAISDLKTIGYGAKFHIDIISDTCDCTGIKAPINAMENIFGKRNHSKHFQAVFGPIKLRLYLIYTDHPWVSKKILKLWSPRDEIKRKLKYGILIIFVILVCGHKFLLFKIDFSSKEIIHLKIIIFFWLSTKEVVSLVAVKFLSYQVLALRKLNNSTNKSLNYILNNFYNDHMID
ncbi:hypothetical protein BpHYR1_015297 [Brachionus plicatilis]|uniref:Uncharacterized protein n=1 Tax=Brachionus plicatilis TaxID=10195 RepID=A0A3M7QQM1_BRAPC|nr:hypothetical protein BpHYR1_015297 [Brachionus plicatilis]